MVIYRTTSALQIFLSVLLKAAFLVCAGVALYHYPENPPVTLIIAVICIMFFALTGTDEILIYSDHFTFIQNGSLKIFGKKRSFPIAEIRSIAVSGNYDTADELVMPASGRGEPFNRIEISMIDGKSYHFTTSVYIKKLNKAVQMIMDIKKSEHQQRT